MAKKLDRLYIRVDALFPADERYQALPYKLRDSAYLFFEALNGWSRDKKTDGRVPLANARAVGRSMEHSPARVEAFLEALAVPAVALVRFEGDVLVIPKYQKWQDTRQEIEERNEARRAAGRKGGLESGRSRREANASPSLDPVVEANAKQNEAETETETETETSASPTSKHVGAPAEPERADVEELCTAMADSVANRGAKRPGVTAAWRREARLLLDRDGHPLAEVLELIAWSAEDQFWRANVLSVPKLREQYDRLQLQRGRNGSVTVPDVDWRTKSSRLNPGLLGDAQ